MTVTELLDELGASMGNRTDLTVARRLLWLNWAQYDLCGFHQKRLFPPIKFHVLEARVLFKLSIVSGTAGADSTTAAIHLPGSSVDMDAYTDWIIKLTDYTGDAPSGLLNQVRTIYSYAGNPTFLAIVEPAWSVAADANTDYEIYKRWYHLLADVDVSPQLSIHSIERMEYIDGGTEIEQVEWPALTGADYAIGLGDPTEFAHHGDNLLFNKTPNAAKAIRMFCYRYPLRLTDAAPETDVCELPEAWHRAVVLGAMQIGFRKLMEPERASEARTRYIEHVNSHKSSFANESRHTPSRMRVKM